MVNFYIYARDYSGSTQGVTYYHQQGLITLEQFQHDVANIQKEIDDKQSESKIIYLHWGHKCYEVSEEETRLAYEHRLGAMGTQPACIIRWLKRNYDICDEHNKIKLLYIITDGLISRRDAAVCFALNRNMKYESVIFHALNLNKHGVDISVAASFFKGHCKTYCNFDIHDETNLGEEYPYESINIENFQDEIERLKSYIKLKHIKKGRHSDALLEVENLKKLRNRLFADLSLKSPELQLTLETRDKDEFMRNFRNSSWYTTLGAPVFNEKVFIDKSISTLINYIVTRKKSFSFDALKLQREFLIVDEEPIVDVNFAPEQEIEFPDIILDDEKGIPVIILTDCNLLMKLIFSNKEINVDKVSPASFSKFRSAMDFPLFLLNDADISESIGYFYTLNVYKELLSRDVKTEPRTRKPFQGGLVLTDTDEFDKYNDYIVAATYFDSKKVNCNMGLFYYVLWKISNSKEWMDKNVLEQFKKYVMRRIKTTKCRIGLSSLPLDPNEISSLPTALWYCVELSSYIFKNDKDNFRHERLRKYYGAAYSMIEILKYFEYDIDVKFIKQRTSLIRHVMALKKISKTEEKMYYVLEKILKKDNGFLVSEIQNPHNLCILSYLNIEHKSMLPDDLDKKTAPLNTEAVHMLYFEGDTTNPESSKDTFEICEKTFRPFFVIDQTRSFYTELFNTAKKVVIHNDSDINMKNKKVAYEDIKALELSRILSVYNLFLNYVKEYRKYPTLPEYIEYILKKRKFYHGKVTVFPKNVYARVADVHTRYQNITNKVDIDEFIKNSKLYYDRINRIKAEGVFKYNNDSEIHTFIADQENKVNLKKLGQDN